MASLNSIETALCFEVEYTAFNAFAPDFGVFIQMYLSALRNIKIAAGRQRIAACAGMLVIVTSLPALLSAQNAAGRSLLKPKDLAEDPDSFYVIDVRSRQSFDEAHIPGARWLDANKWTRLSLSDNGLTDQAAWTTMLQEAGLDNQKPTVVVGDSITTTARIWWLLAYLGLQDVRMIDGDLAAWSELDLPLVSDASEITPSNFEAEFQKDRLATFEQVTVIANGDTKTQVLDNRSAREFSGVMPGAGHIPEAVHVEWTMFLDSDGRFLPPEKIQSLLKEKNIELEQPLVMHCRTGARCSVAVFALELAGAKNVKNYYKGWSEYMLQENADIAK